ncbi:unnamed protein product [Discosporangium mesarthrocarpum]
MPITDFDVTYGNALAPAGFHRVTTKDGGAANLNGKSSSLQSFLWTHEGAHRGDPIVQLCVTHDEDAAPQGFERVSRDLIKGGTSGRKAYLWLQRQSHVAVPTSATGDSVGTGRHAEAGEGQGTEVPYFPLAEVVVVFGRSDLNAPYVDENRDEEMKPWEHLEHCLNPWAADREDPVFLWFRRSKFEASSPTYKLEVSCVLLSTTQKGWRTLKLMGAETYYGDVAPHFFEFVSDQFMVRLIPPLHSKQISRLFLLCSCMRVSEWHTHRPSNPGNLTAEKVIEVTKRVKDLSTDITDGVSEEVKHSKEDNRFWSEFLPQFVEECLTSVDFDMRMLTLVNNFLALMLEVVAINLRKTGPMPPYLLDTLSRIGQSHTYNGLYYITYGLESKSEVPTPELCLTDDKHKSVEVVMSNPCGSLCTPVGLFASQQEVSDLFLLNMSHFGRAGGFAAILDRMDPNWKPEPVALEELVVYVCFLRVNCHCFLPAFADRYFNSVQERLFWRFDHLSNAELKELSNSGDSSFPALILKNLEAVLPVALPRFKMEDRLELLHLSLALQLLNCPYLNARIQGITLVNSTMDRMVRDHATRRTQTQQSERSCAAWLANWLDEQGVLEMALGDAEHFRNSSKGKSYCLAIRTVTIRSIGTSSSIQVDSPQDTHVEILQRAVDLFCFMAQQEKLRTRHLNLLWAASQGQPEAQVRVVYNLVVQLSSCVGAAGLDVLHTHLRALPPTYEDIHIDLIKGFALAAARRACMHGPVPVSVFGYGLELLWAAVQDDSPVTALVADQASEALAELLCLADGGQESYVHDAFSHVGHTVVNNKISGSRGSSAAAGRDLHQQQLLFLLDMCLENVEKGLSVAPSLRLMQRIIDAQPELTLTDHESGRRSGKDKLLLGLEEQKGLLRLLVEELLRYHREAGIAARNYPAGAELLSRPLAGTRIPHGQALKIRLDFIAFAVSSSPVDLTFDHVQLLWKAIVVDCLDAQETEIFFEWMRRTAPHGASSSVYSAMSDEVSGKPNMHHIFSKLLCEPGGMQFETLGEEGFHCVWSYFHLVNSQSNALSRVSKVNYVVKDFARIEGLDTLWEVFLASRDPCVVREAGQQLVQLHLNLGDPGDKRAVWGSFIGRGMLHIEDALSTLDRSATNRNHDVNFKDWSTVAERVIRLLAKFLSDTEKPPTPSTHDGWGGLHEEGHVKVMVRQTGRTLLRKFVWLRRKEDVTVGELRARIACEIRHPPNQVRLLNSHAQACSSPAHDDFMLEDASILTSCEAILLQAPEHDTVNYAPQPNARARPWDRGTTTNFPKERLVDHSQYFDTLFRLMEASVEEQASLVECTWGLVQTLPINLAVRSNLEEIRNRSSPSTTALAVKGMTNLSKGAMLSVEASEDARQGSSGGSEHWRESDTMQQPQGMYGSSCRPFHKEGGMGVEGLDWAELLGRTSIPKLLYRLQVVFTLVEAAENPYALPGDRVDAISWRKAFIVKGGVDFLLSLLQEGALDLSKGIHRACLALLLKLVVYFALPKWSVNVHNTAQQTGDNVTAEEGGGCSHHSVIRSTGIKDSTSRPDSEELLATYFSDVNVTNLVQCLLTVMSEVSEPTNDLRCKAQLDRPPDMLQGHKTVVKGDLDQVGQWWRSTAVLEGGDSITGRGRGNLRTERHQVPPEAEVMQHTMTILVTLALHKPELLDVILNYPHLGSTLEYSLLSTPEKMVRKEVAAGVLRMAHELRSSAKEDPVQIFVRLLLPLLPRVNAHEENCNHFFGLLACLVREKGAVAPEDHIHLCMQLADLIITRPVVEQSEGDLDLVLLGYMQVLSSALSSLPPELEVEVKGGAGGDVDGGGRGLVQELFENCLFTLPHKPVNPPEGGLATGLSNLNSALLCCAFLVPKVDSAPSSKCKSEESRVAAFKLLAELAYGCTDNLSLVTKLAEPHHKLERSTECKERIAGEKSVWLGAATNTSTSTNSRMGVSVQPPTLGCKAPPLTKHKSGFVGLKNPGCICYMNSTLQQLFMVPELRQGILSFQDCGNPSEGHLMWHLQNTFSHLQESQKADFDPIGLVRSVRDWDGRPMDLTVQQDASEFLTLFFQQVEGCIMGSPVENLLKETFGGMYSNELLAEGGRYSERPEHFSYISVEVKNMKTLHEALTAFTKEETVSFKWDRNGVGESGENKEVTLSTQKRCSIKVLPKHLVIHLKRFGFDFDRMQQTKINDRLEFPTELNMFHYTKEGFSAKGDAATPSLVHPLVQNNHQSFDDHSVKPMEYYHYNLAGVVVHMGTANSGHYYSYIRPRDGAGGWLEFNDSLVTEFDPKDLEVECFGGEEVSPRYRQAPINSDQMRERTRNAFLLVYDQVLLPKEKCHKVDAHDNLTVPLGELILSDSQEWVSSGEGVSSERALGYTGSSGILRRGSQKRRLRAHVPDAIMNDIWRENMEFWRAKHVMEKHNYSFLYQLLVQDSERHGGRAGKDILQLTSSCALSTLLQAEEHELLSQWIHVLLGLLPKQPEACDWLLNKLVKELGTLQELLEGSDKIRSTIGDLVCVVLRTSSVNAMTNEFSANEMESGPAGDLKDRSVGGHVTPAASFSNTCLGFLLAAQGGKGHLSQVCVWLSTYASTGPVARQHLLANGALGLLLSLFIGDHSLFLKLQEAPMGRGCSSNGLERQKVATAPVVGDLIKGCDLSDLLTVMSQLLRSSSLTFKDKHIRDDDAIRSKQGGLEKMDKKVSQDLPFALIPLMKIAPEEEQMIRSRDFVCRLVRELGPCWAQQELHAVIGHLCWRNKLMSQLILDIACQGVERYEESNAHLLKASFRALIFIFEKVTDNLQCWRVSTAMPKLLSTMKDEAPLESREQAIEMLVRMGKSSAQVRAWLAGHPQELEWVEAWLQPTSDPSTRRAHFPQGHGITQHWTSVTMMERVLKEQWHCVSLQNVQALARGEDIPIPGYDSDDDPHLLVKKRIQVRWAGGHWYPGVVTDFDDVTGKHHVQYDDNDQRKYCMGTKNWQLE